MKNLFLTAIVLYRKCISPLMPPSCRFQPTCSEYGYEAISRFGIIKGSALLLRRVLKCHPFNPGGYDPIPGQTENINFRMGNG